MSPRKSPPRRKKAKEVTNEELKTLRYYAWRVSKACHRGRWVLMPIESAHLLQKLAGEEPSPHPDNACRVGKPRVIGWLRKIADNYPKAPQAVEGGF